MVTIFDMVTGELIHSDAPADAETAGSVMREPEHLAPRLQTVEEARAAEPPRHTFPADLAQADIASFLSRQ